jgi:hypothetical protein
MSLVTASERDVVQTEALTGNVVFGLAFIDRRFSRSLLERSVIQGDNPVSRTSTSCVSSRVAGIGNSS